jgi:hypothetical protein
VILVSVGLIFLNLQVTPKCIGIWNPRKCTNKLVLPALLLAMVANSMLFFLPTKYLGIHSLWYIYCLVFIINLTCLQLHLIAWAWCSDSKPARAYVSNESKIFCSLLFYVCSDARSSFNIHFFCFNCFRLKIFAPISILAFAVLLPVNWNNDTLQLSKAHHSNIDKLSISNIPVGSKRLAHDYFIFLWMFALFFLGRQHITTTTKPFSLKQVG